MDVAVRREVDGEYALTCLEGGDHVMESNAGCDEGGDDPGRPNACEGRLQQDGQGGGTESPGQRMSWYPSLDALARATAAALVSPAVAAVSKDAMAEEYQWGWVWPWIRTVKPPADVQDCVRARSDP